MADSVTVQPVLNETENATETNGTGKIPATPEGMAIAYGSLFLMAVIPIFLGSIRSVTFHKEQKDSGEKPETMTHKDAAMFPIIASCALFGIYLVFQIFSKEHINLLLASYFFLLGVLALTHIVGPFVSKLLPAAFPNENYHIHLTQGTGNKKEETQFQLGWIVGAADIINYEFDRKDLVSLSLCGVIGAWYLWKKHWIANNLFGLAFSINGVELLSLNRVSTGCILLGGLFVYDIFWVFGTNVMVTVAKSFEAPIKLVFPQDLLQHGLAANNFAMLGLGDIVIPGIFIALLLRFDMSLKRKSRVYFIAGFVAYCLGLGTTIFIMHFFKHAQPALLYLVPACLGLPTCVALVRGDITAMFSYEDHAEEPKTKGVSKKEK